MGHKLLEESVSAVVLGSLNPAIFQPKWLSKENLLREAEANNATIEVISPHVTKFDAGWLRILVTRQRFHAQTTDPSHYLPLRDFVSGVFSLLEYTPVQRVGVNCTFLVQYDTRQEWHALGHRLAPKQEWAAVTKNPGLASMQIQSERDDGFKGSLNILLTSIGLPDNSVNIEFNNDLVPNVDNGLGVREVINGCWDRVVEDAKVKRDTLLRQWTS